MAHSLEIRVPLVDLELLRRVAPLLARRDPPTKLDMARTPASPLADEVLHRPKSGFSIPVPQWLAETGDYREYSRLRGLRGWALLLNFRPYAPRSNQPRTHDSPAHRLNGKRYHEHWLHNLMASTSLMGFRNRAPAIR